MNIETTLSVNFGSRRKDLSTVAYTLYDKGKNVIQSRTTSGVTELISSTGLYQVLISLPAAFIGSVVWDTGEATKLYSIEDVDFRKFTYQSSVIIGGGPKKGVWTEKEKKKLLKDIKRLIEAIAKIKIKDNTLILEAIESNIKEVGKRGLVNYDVINESLNLIRSEVKAKDTAHSKFINESIDLILSEVRKGDAIKTLQEGIDKLSDGLIAIIENSEAESVVKEAKEYVKDKDT